MSGGQGQINVVPAQLEAAASQAGNAAMWAGTGRGTLAEAVVGEAGCDPIAQPAFAAMHAAWLNQAGFLAECAHGLSSALSGASFDYPAVDAAQMVDVWDHP